MNAYRPYGRFRRVRNFFEVMAMDTEELETQHDERLVGQAPRYGMVRLTQRQLEVLQLLCEGLPNKLICRRLAIAPGTVKTHIAAVLRELRVSSRVQAVAVAHRLGLVRSRNTTSR